ncbi:MAG: hypothetical protein HQM12_03170 [SAR324 cluster bacterium]|nr:hypothetical protein [SAR324 cluster bacterium]
MSDSINWQEVIIEACSWAESQFGTKLVVDSDIINEIQIMSEASLQSYHPVKPNVAKIAGHIAFWIRKL